MILDKIRDEIQRLNKIVYGDFGIELKCVIYIGRAEIIELKNDERLMYTSCVPVEEATILGFEIENVDRESYFHVGVSI